MRRIRFVIIRKVPGAREMEWHRHWQLTYPLLVMQSLDTIPSAPSPVAVHESLEGSLQLRDGKQDLGAGAPRADGAGRGYLP